MAKMTTDAPERIGDLVRALPPTEVSTNGPTPVNRASVYGGGNTPYGAVGKQRKCQLPNCQQPFTQKNSSGDARFCKAEHKNEYWRLAAKIGDQVMQGELTVSGTSQKKSVLAVLKKNPKQWVYLRTILPFIIVRDSIAKLRKQGHEIRMRRVWRDDLQRTEYQYRLFEKAAS